MRTIYRTSGRAQEYAELALNLYKGCEVGCSYCYAPSATFTTKKEFHEKYMPRHGILQYLEKDACKFKGKEVLFSFTSDPYQPLESIVKVTREAIKILQKNDIAVNILTKGALLATRDFDLLRPGIDKFGTTLTLTCANQSREYEPHASTPTQRIAALAKAKSLGLYTWVSLEPVIKPECSLRLIHLTYRFVDHYKVGKWNYDTRAKHINWQNFLLHVTTVLKGYKKDFYIKNELQKYGGME